jgi:hypothetical protein
MKSLASVLFVVFIYTSTLAQNINTNISNGVTFDGEPYLAINPANPQNLVAAWMGLKLSNGSFKIAIKTRASFDGGNTWSTTYALPHMGSQYGSADPSLVFDKNGLLYACYIDYKKSPDSGGIYIARSVDGGLNWDTPSKAYDMYDDGSKKPIDRPWLVIDNSTTANFGTLYITSKPPQWVAPPNRNYFKASSDSGHTWTAIKNIDGGTHLIGNAIAQPMATPAVTTGGKFCAAYPSYVASQNLLPAIYLAQSRDKGQTFDYSTILTTPPAANDSNYKNGYLLIANPADSNQLVFVSPAATNGDADIMALHSNDGGQTWSSTVRVNDDAIANGKGQDMVWAAYNEQGTLVVTWRDRRDASPNGFWNAGYDFYYATSTDNGQTFSANQKLSSQFIAFDSLLTSDGNDFMSCVYLADTLYSVWGDTRTGKLNVYFTKTVVSSNTNVGISILEGPDNTLAVFPNPTQSDVTVLVTDEMKGKEIQLLDGSGKILFRKIITDTRFHVSIAQNPRGLYFIKAGNQVKKVLKD